MNKQTIASRSIDITTKNLLVLILLWFFSLCIFFCTHIKMIPQLIDPAYGHYHHERALIPGTMTTFTERQTGEVKRNKRISLTKISSRVKKKSRRWRRWEKKRQNKTWPRNNKAKDRREQLIRESFANLTANEKKKTTIMGP